MRTTLLPVFALLAATLTTLSAPAFAHHGNAVYDAGTITLTGTVTAYQFINPHILIYVDAMGPKGDVQHWTIEGAPPSMAIHQGWTKDMLKPGDQIVYMVHAARNGSHLGRGVDSMTVNGRVLGREPGATQ